MEQLPKNPLRQEIDLTIRKLLGERVLKVFHTPHEPGSGEIDVLLDLVSVKEGSGPWVMVMEYQPSEEGTTIAKLENYFLMPGSDQVFIQTFKPDMTCEQAVQRDFGQDDYERLQDILQKISSQEEK